MDIRLDYADFNPAFRRLARLAPVKSPKPVLANILLQTPLGTAGVVRLTATDLEITASVEVKAAVDEPGSCLVPASRMGTLLSAVPGGSFRLTVEGDELTVGTGLFGSTGTHALATERPDEFPATDLALEDGPGHWTVTASHLAAALSATLDATDAESTRYALGGVRIEPARDGEPRGLIVVGTDGRRLHKADLAASAVGYPFKPTQHGGILPVRAAKILADILREHGHAEAALTLGPNRISCRVGGAVLLARPVDGRYPAWRDVFPPEKPAAVASFATPDELIALFKQAAITTSEESRGVMFEVDSGGVTLSSRAADVGRGRVDGGLVAFAGEPQWALLDSRYPEAALAACAKASALGGPDADAEPVEVELRGPKAAVILRSGPVSTVIMPLTVEGTPELHRPACREALAARQRKTVEETAELEEAGAI